MSSVWAASSAAVAGRASAAAVAGGAGLSRFGFSSMNSAVSSGLVSRSSRIPPPVRIRVPEVVMSLAFFVLRATGAADDVLGIGLMGRYRALVGKAI